MTDIIGGIIGGVGSLFGGSSAKSNAMTGYNYLTGQRGQPGDIPFANNGVNASNAEANLLGLNGPSGSAAASPAFQNYLNSTGYQFQMDQGTRALTGSAAARGILNSGSTAKALTKYGQGLASASFGNYLNTLGGVAGQGLTANGQIGQAGTQGGATAAQAKAGADSNFFGSLAGLAGPVMALL